MGPHHLRLDLDINFGHAVAVHEADCPDIGPICQVRAEPPQLHHTSVWLTDIRLFSEYGLAPHWAVQAVLPLRIVGARTMFSDLSGNPITLDYPSIHHHNEDLVGLGDLQLYLHYSARLSTDVLLGARFGLSLPTGKVQPNPYTLGDLGLPHEHIQFGTGTFDPLIALDMTKTFEHWSLAAFGQAQLPLYRDRYGYQAGTRVVSGVVASSNVGRSGPTFRLGIIGVHEFAERWDGQVPTTDGNQGRTDLFVGPGITIPFLQDWSASLDVRFRAYGHVVGAQFSLPVVFELSFGRLFHLESGYSEPERQHVAADRQASTGDVEDVVQHGELVELSPASKKWTVFDFWAPWCEACKVLDAGLRDRAAARAELGFAHRTAGAARHNGFASRSAGRTVRPDRLRGQRYAGRLASTDRCRVEEW